MPKSERCRVSSIGVARLLPVSEFDTSLSTGAAPVILGFKSKITESVFSGQCPKGFSADLFEGARRKLRALNAAQMLEDLTSLPGNRLEALKGDRLGQHSIRVNDQWRVCFRWAGAGPEDVEIVDYH